MPEVAAGSIEPTPSVSVPAESPASPPSVSSPPSSSTPPHKSSFGKLAIWLFGLIIVLLGVYYFMNPMKGSPQIMKTQTPSGQKPLIKLVVNPWQASDLNVNVAKVILEDRMGYKVELVSMDEVAQWDALANGTVHASLEIWPSGHKDHIKKYIDTDKTVENGGPLGPVGKIGWYIPTYLVKENPTLATWQGFKDPKNVALFAATTGGKGQFFTGDPTWTQYDDQIIKNLGLNFEVKMLGSEDALIDVVDKAYTAKKPVVFYFWTPHWAHAKYDLTAVSLPPYSDDCYADLKGGVNCDYPKEQLLKVFWAGLKGYAPEAYQFLTKFNYTNEDQIRMLAAMQQKKQTAEEVARNWVQSNEAIWQLWLPQ